MTNKDVKLTDLLDENLIPECFYAARLAGAAFNRAADTLDLQILSDDYILTDDVLSFQAALSAELGSVTTIYPKYPPDIFNADYVEDIVLLLKRKNPFVNGFLDDADVTLADNTLTLTLKRGGVDILQNDKFDTKLASTINHMFSRKVAVCFSGVTEPNIAARVLAEDNAPVSVVSRPAPVFERNTRNGRRATLKVLEKPKSVKIDYLADKLQQEAKLIAGKAITDAPVKMRDLTHQEENCVLWGTIFKSDERTVKDGQFLVAKIYFSDRTSSEIIKIFTPSEGAEGLKCLQPDTTIIVRGGFEYDEYEKEELFKPTSIMTAKLHPREDNAPEKRVELHMHTKMSDKDGVSTAKELVEQAFEWGHRAVAVTDHGNLQAYPEAMNTFEALTKGKDVDFKMIYGIEAYFVNDGALIIDEGKERSVDDEFIVFDTETTGFSPTNDRITEIGAVRVVNRQIVDTFNTFVNAGVMVPAIITDKTGITDAMLEGAPDEAQALRQFIEFCGEKPLLVAHNAPFDKGFLSATLSRCGVDYAYDTLDTLAVCRAVYPTIKKHGLDDMRRHFRFEEFGHHRASNDAEMLTRIFLKIIAELESNNQIKLFGDINSVLTGDSFAKARARHMIILVKNQVGLKNLYRLVSRSYLHDFYKKPRIFLSSLRQHREGLILGSACEAGELYRAIVEGKSDEQLTEIAKLYDFLEIQPNTNNMFLVRESRVANEAMLEVYNQKIIKLGKKLGIPVCATCDVHFKDEEDIIYREALQAAQEYDDFDGKANLYFRTTEEMLGEFAYLGEETAKEVVITNPNKIADLIEQVRPIPLGVFTPQMDGAEEELQLFTHDKAKELYGDPLPPIVKARLDKEVTAIVKHGFSVLYMIAEKLVKESERHGYHVGSRGSVGSSFVATMLGISEVNPLPPHYRCPKCRHTEFSSAALSGYDLPPKTCPTCNVPMISDGHDIPFETFLGFKGEKSPDIDLNFSGEYQAQSHRYTEELFGKEYVFKAGTISCIQDKTAFGYAKKYAEAKGVKISKAEIERIASGVVGVKNTTSQHAGGMVVVPNTMDVYDFTPIQHPGKLNEGDDTDGNIITTHFDFHALHDTILKLDELGHDVPTLYKRLEDSSGIKIADVPTSDHEVIKLFTSTEPLNLSKQDSEIIPVGTYGLPEMGTPFVIRMLKEAKPQTFADLLQISGLSHGTDVWNGNAQELINNGTCTISNVIGTRDNIMVYLMSRGMPGDVAFKITEITRKGKAKKQFDEAIYAAFKEYDIPDWYVDSCKKIKYMFPKAHAAAYVTSAIKLGWFKVHRPLDFYAAVLSRHTSAIDIKSALSGSDAVRAKIADITRLRSEKKDTPNDNAAYDAMLLVYEMLLRGIAFLPPHYLKSHPLRYEPEGNNLRLPYLVIPNCAEKSAVKLYEAIKADTYVCIDDIKKAAEINAKTLDAMVAENLFGDLPMSAQISLFDL
ncbi:MAG: PolC-type DNA polymerase III [Oscillospiraceae bacterium]|jgi:DNA polymerase-3 subunit alpha (Gram-positive type)|nr:PolC-type DNA polymerase III [Oscillospiraceae bacterium]